MPSGDVVPLRGALAERPGESFECVKTVEQALAVLSKLETAITVGFLVLDKVGSYPEEVVVSGVRDVLRAAFTLIN